MTKLPGANGVMINNELSENSGRLDEHGGDGLGQSTDSTRRPQANRTMRYKRREGNTIRVPIWSGGSSRRDDLRDGKSLETFQPIPIQSETKQG